MDVSDSEQNAINLTEVYRNCIWRYQEDSSDLGNGGNGSGGEESDNGNNSGSENKPGNGNNPDSGNTENVNDSAVEYYEFQAEWYAKEFSNFDSSFAQEYYTMLSEDPWFVGAVNAWSGIHFVAEPSYIAGQLTKKDLYVLVIYDLLTGHSGEFENPMDLFESQSMEYMYDAVKIIFGSEKIDMDDLKKISPALYKDTMMNSELFEDMDVVSDIFDIFDNLYDALEACARYQAIANMSVGFKNVLLEVYNDTSNEDSLRNAAKYCIDIFENACNVTMGKILLNEYSKVTAKYLLGEIIDLAWENLATTMFPPVLIAQFAVKGVVVLADTLFNLDATTQAYYQLKAVVGFENAIRKILADNEFDYSDREQCEKYMYAIETFEKVVLLGIDYSADLLQTKFDSLSLTSSEREECEALIVTLGEIKAERGEFYISVENLCQKAYKVYCILDIDGYDSPVTTIKLLYAVGNFEGSYNATNHQGETHAKISIHIVNELLKDEEKLQEYADAATACTTNEDGVVQKIYTVEDIKNAIGNRAMDFIVIFEYGPTETNLDVEDGLYTMSISYDWKTQTYNLVGLDWIQHETYIMADFLNMILNGDNFSGDVYALDSWLFMTEYKKVGEISVNK